MRKTWAVMLRDLIRMVRNPITLLSSVALPLVYLTILGNSLQGPVKGLPGGRGHARRRSPRRDVWRARFRPLRTDRARSNWCASMGSWTGCGRCATAPSPDCSWSHRASLRTCGAGKRPPSACSWTTSMPSVLRRSTRRSRARCPRHVIRSCDSRSISVRRSYAAKRSIRALTMMPRLCRASSCCRSSWGA